MAKNKAEDKIGTATIDEEERKGLDPNPDSNPDAITGEPGSHPVGTAVGGAGGAAAGAAIGGAVGGPIGAVVGGAVGAIAGGLAGKGAAEVVDPTVEGAYWRENYKNRPYYKKDKSYKDYEPAYRYGWESATKPEYQGRSFNEIETDLEKGWPSYHRTPTGAWTDFRDATHDAYDRVRTRTAEQTGSSFWNQVEGNWRQFKGYLKEKFNRLTDDEIEEMQGRKERIVGKIQEKYGEAEYDEIRIEEELRDFRLK